MIKIVGLTVSKTGGGKRLHNEIDYNSLKT